MILVISGDPIISHALWRWLLKRLRTSPVTKVALHFKHCTFCHFGFLCSVHLRCCGTFVNIVCVMMGSSKLPRSQASMKARVASSTYLSRSARSGALQESKSEDLRWDSDGTQIEQTLTQTVLKIQCPHSCLICGSLSDRAK